MTGPHLIGQIRKAINEAAADLEDASAAHEASESLVDLEWRERAEGRLDGLNEALTIVRETFGPPPALPGFVTTKGDPNATD